MSATTVLPQQNAIDERRGQRIVWFLARCIALLMTGYGLAIPVFARRFADFGAGVSELGFLTLAFALAQMVLAPFMGGLADRFGRRPLILLSLVGVVGANVAYVLLTSIPGYVVARFLQGGITAGLVPASLAVVGDIFPANRRGQWAGIVMGSYGAGFIIGPALGGVLYDRWGFAAPFALSAALAAVALVAALVLVPETRPVGAVTAVGEAQRPRRSLVASFPRPLAVFGTLILLDFVAYFGFAFIEPSMAFFFYDERQFSATQFGLIVGGYGLAMVVGQGALGQLSDRIGRLVPIAVGFVVSSIFYFGLPIFPQFGALVTIAIISGLGTALVGPALSTYYLDITPEADRSRVLGFKESAAASGGVAGPLAVAIVSRWIDAATIFIIAGVLTVGVVPLALAVLRGSQRRDPIAADRQNREAEAGRAGQV